MKVMKKNSIAKEEKQEERIMVTPEQAIKWLEATNFSNRNIRDSLVDKIARDIKNGKWIYDGSPIRFNKKGDLIDGQHRLWAVVRSQIPVEILIIRDLEDNCIHTIDTGVSRSNADILHFSGYSYPTIVANACRISIGYKKCSGDLYNWAKSRSDIIISPQELLEEASDNKVLVSACASLGNDKFMKKFMGAGTAAFCYYIFARKDKRVADEFFYLLSKGTNLADGSPIISLRNSLTLRDHFLTRIAKGGNHRSAYLIALIIKAWNFYRTGKEVQRLTFSEDREEYPQPI